MEANKITYLDYLVDVAADDVAGLKKAEKSYGDSWKKRGGVGAFMMLARKWDRLEKQVAQDVAYTPVLVGATLVTASPFDIFAHVAVDPRSEGVLDDIRDLRRYLMLVEAEVRARGTNPEHRDNA